MESYIFGFFLFERYLVVYTLAGRCLFCNSVHHFPRDIALSEITTLCPVNVANLRYYRADVFVLRVIIYTKWALKRKCAYKFSGHQVKINISDGSI